MIQFLGSCTAGAVLVLVVVCPFARRGRGRHVSRPVGRRARLDAAAVSVVQVLWIAFEVGYVILAGPGIVSLILQALVAGWLLDDVLTGGRDDRDDRKRRWAKAKLRMPKPIRLRPVERWAPVPG